MQCFWCGTEAPECPACRATGVCEDHSAFHRQNGRCLPVRVVEKSGVGRCVVALKDLDPGELIFQDQPLVWGSKPGFCLSCLRSTRDEHAECKMPLCQGCQHEANECKVYQQFVNDDRVSRDELSEFSAPLRLFFVAKAAGRNLELLMDHNAEEEGSDGWKRVGLVAKVFAENLLVTSDQSSTEDIEKLLMRCVGLLRTNALGLELGNGRIMFPFFSFLSHSCVHNCVHFVGKDRSIKLYSKTPVKAGDELTITYANLLRPTAKRQEQFGQVWHFQCGCRRCQDPEEFGIKLDEMICPFCREVLARNRCSKCDKVVPSSDVITAQLQDLLHDMKSGPSQVEEFLKMTQPILGPQHYITLIAKRYLTQLYTNYKDKEQMTKKIGLCQELLRVFDVFDPGLSQSRGMTLYQLSAAQLALGEDANHALKECIKCLANEPNGSSGFALRMKAVKLLKP